MMTEREAMMNHILAWVREAIDESRATDSVIAMSALAAADAPPVADAPPDMAAEICRAATNLVIGALTVVTGGAFGCCELDDGDLDVWGEDWRLRVRP